MSDSQGQTKYGLLREEKAGIDPADTSSASLFGKERCFGAIFGRGLDHYRPPHHNAVGLEPCNRRERFGECILMLILVLLR
jgi:hypothetical protein